jgi:cell growth-regulating nucleolar protein
MFRPRYKTTRLSITVDVSLAPLRPNELVISFCRTFANAPSECQTCMTEDQKYQGKLYKEKKPKQQKQNSQSDNAQALVPRKPYVEDVPDDDRVAIVDAPPHAPSPPPPAKSLENGGVNVFDFLVTDSTPNASRVNLPEVDESRMIEDSNPPAYSEVATPAEPDRRLRGHCKTESHDSAYAQNGYSYGSTPVEPSFERFDSYQRLPIEQYLDEPSPPPDPKDYYTPAPKHEIRRPREPDTAPSSAIISKSDKKRKRANVEGLDMALVRAQVERDAVMEDAPPLLHSGLTGGLSRMLNRPEFPPSPDYSGGDWVDASPLSPMKRSKQTHIERERGRDRESKPRKITHARAHGSTIHGNGAWVRHRRHRDDSRAERGRRSDRLGEGRRRRRSSSSVSQDRGVRGLLDAPKPMKAIEYHQTRSRSLSAEPSDGNAMVLHNTSSNGKGALVTTSKTNGHHGNGEAVSVSQARVDLFMGFVTKGPESERGCSINKALKRFHRERADRWDHGASWGGMSKMEEEKELWKSLRLKRNERGEIVLFFDAP